MRVIKKWISAILIISCIFSIHSLYSAELIVEDIFVKDIQTIDVILSENPNMQVGVQDNTEIVVLEDVKIAWGMLQSDSSRQVELKTEAPIQPFMRYSLLTLSGTEGSIDFETPSWVEGYKASNFTSMKTEDIDSIEIIDAYTILVNYRQELSGLNYGFKLFAEVEITEIRKDDFQLPVLTLEMEAPLLSETDYILMFIDMRDAEWNVIEFDTGIYDFSTEVFEEEVLNDVSRDVSMYQDDQIPPELLQELENSLLEDEILLNAAPEVISEGNIEEMAQNMKPTDPEAWAGTGILILLTLIINAFFYKARRKRLVLA